MEIFISMHGHISMILITDFRCAQTGWFVHFLSRQEPLVLFIYLFIYFLLSSLVVSARSVDFCMMISSVNFCLLYQFWWPLHYGGVRMVLLIKLYLFIAPLVIEAVISWSQWCQIFFSWKLYVLDRLSRNFIRSLKASTRSWVWHVHVFFKENNWRVS